MNYSRIVLFCIALLTLSFQAHTAPDNTELSVWANEAIVATYTYNFQNFMARQKEIAKYFTATGWITYSKALQDAKLPEAVQQNSYEVTSVATLPPTIKTINKQQWQAIMPLLVVYKNPQYQQKQTLEITLNFIKAPEGQGVRGLSITSLLAKVAKPMCRCSNESKPHMAIV